MRWSPATVAAPRDGGGACSRSSDDAVGGHSMPAAAWPDHAGSTPAAILLQLMPGQAAGDALADALFGEAEPLGRLPLTFPAIGGELASERHTGVLRRQHSWIWDHDPHARSLPQNVQAVARAWRWVQMVPRKWQGPLPFGYGLGYASWSYSRLQIIGRVDASTMPPSAALRRQDDYDLCHRCATLCDLPSGSATKAVAWLHKVALTSGESVGRHFR